MIQVKTLPENLVSNYVKLARTKYYIQEMNVLFKKLSYDCVVLTSSHELWQTLTFICCKLEEEYYLY